MIDVKELRIGNIAETPDGWVHPIAAIYLYENVSFDLHGLGAGFKSFKINEIKPIPITREWLLKLGFELSEGCTSDFEIKIGKDTLRTSPLSDKNPTLQSDEDNEFNIIALRKIKYIHQLQNLFYCLTGEELKLQES